MTPAKFATLVRYYTKTDSTSFTDAEILALTNIVKDEMCAEIAKEVNEDAFTMRFYRNLVAGQRNYLLPAEMMQHLKYVEAIIDGTNQEYLTEFDLNSFKRPTDEANIILAYSGKKPQYDIIGGELIIYSGTAIIDVTDGLIVRAEQYPDDLTSLAGTTDMSVAPSTTSFGIPRAIHELMARRVSIAFKSSKDKPIPLSEKEKMYEIDWKDTKNTMKGMNFDRVVEATVPVNDGQDY